MTAFLNTARKKYLDQKPLPWSTWKNQWRRCSGENACIGLLHYGLRTEVRSAEEESERRRFYLTLADGHYSPDLEQSHKMTGDERRIARKAFDVLFGTRYSSDVFDKRLLTLPPDAIEALLHFFRPRGTDESCGLENLRITAGDTEDRDHAMKKTNEALLRWLVSLWDKDFVYEGPYSSGPIGPWVKNQATYALVQEVRPRVLEMLHAYGHGQLEKLLDKVGCAIEERHIVYRVQWELFTPDCTSKLEELASRSSRLVGVHTTGDAVKAALVSGSSAAKVLTLVWRAQGHLMHKHEVE